MKKILIVTCILTLVTMSSISAKDNVTPTYKMVSSGNRTSGGNYGNSNSNSNNWKEAYTNSLIMNNVIRKASNNEILIWIQKAQMNGYPTNHMMRPDYTYIVQKGFNIPEDFCYNHYINFIILRVRPSQLIYKMRLLLFAKWLPERQNSRRLA